MFKALLYIGVDPQSEGVKIAPPLFKVARIFGGPLMGLARNLLGIEEVFLNCAGRFGCDLRGSGDEGENDIDLESQTHNVSVDIFPTQSLTIPRQGPINTTPNFR